MMTKAKTIPDKAKPLVFAATGLSAASLAWTTWSLLDLLKVGWIGLTVAVSADVIWAALIWCEYKGIGRPAFIKTIGWLTVLVVGGFIAGHGIMRNSPAMAIAGPFLTLGAKIVWEAALMAMKDPTAPTHKDQTKLDDQIRDINVETEQKRVETRREIAEEEARVEKKIAKIRADARLKKEELLATREVAEAQRILDEELRQSGYELVRMDRVIPGETVPQIEAPQPAAIPAPAAPVTPPAAAPPAAPVAPKGTFPAARPSAASTAITVPVEGLSKAQKDLKRLAAAWYLAESQAKAQGVALAKAEFARRIGINKAQVSRATLNFKPEDISQGDYTEAEAEVSRSTLDFKPEIEAEAEIESA